MARRPPARAPGRRRTARLAGRRDLTRCWRGPRARPLGAPLPGLGLAGRVRFLGQSVPSVLAEIYAAADVLVLASSRERWANVLLEAMACGKPVVASDVWGTPEVVTEAAAGLLVKARGSPGSAQAIAQLLEHPPDRAATRPYAERFSWDATTAGRPRAVFGDRYATRPHGRPILGQSTLLSKDFAEDFAEDSDSRADAMVSRTRALIRNHS